MTSSEQLVCAGYTAFPNTVPENLRQLCVEELNKNPDEFWYWRGPLAEEFREWFRAFLAEVLPDVFGEADLAVFNRNNGSWMDWHEDSSGGDTNYGRRVFCSAYLTPTDSDRGALQIISGSHLWVRASKLELVAPCEIDTLKMPAGTVFVGDERLWHAVSENKAPGRRTMVMWWRWIPVQK